MLAHELIVLFGVYNLSDHYEVGRITLSPEKIKVHPDWNSSDTRQDADITIMTFESGAIPSSKFIQPICLWSDAIPPTQTNGYIGSWGVNRQSQNAYEGTPSKRKVQIVFNIFCFLRTKNLTNLATSRTFCAGSGNETGICEGDNGGGVTIQVGSVFYFRGIVSSSLYDQISCDLVAMSQSSPFLLTS